MPDWNHLEARQRFFRILSPFFPDLPLISQLEFLRIEPGCGLAQFKNLKAPYIQSLTSWLLAGHFSRKLR
jgi:hypothetical protein